MLSYTHLSFSIFMTIFARGPTLAITRTCLLWILLELRMMEVVVTAGANRYPKLQSNYHHNKPTPAIYRSDALHVTQPTVSKHSYNLQLSTTMINQTGVTFVVPELLPTKRYTLHVRVLMFKTFEMMHGSWLLHSV